MKARVENHTDLVKDTTTGSVINTNRSAFAKYKKSKKTSMQDKRKIADLENRLAKMESLIESLIDGRS